MKVTREFNEYRPWAGAVHAYNYIEEEGKLEELEYFLEDILGDIADETTVNDILWFEPETVFDSLGLKNPWDDDDEEEEEEEEEEED